MSRRAFNLAEFANGLQSDIDEVRGQMGGIVAILRDIEIELRSMELKIQVAAKMAEPKNKKEVKDDGDSSNE